MTEHMFGLVRNANERTIKAMERVANESDGEVWVNGGNIPGNGRMHWFCSRNRGFPFDQELAKQIKIKLENYL